MPDERTGARRRRILVGVVGSPQGVRGEVRIKSYTGVATGLRDYPLFTAPSGGRQLTVVSARVLKGDMIVVRLEGLSSREAVAALTGTPLFVERDALPRIGEDEFYNADLIGLAAETPEGVRIGEVTAVVNYGAGDLLEIETGRGASAFVPFLKRFVPVVDIARGTLVVVPDALSPDAGDELPEDAVP